MKLTIEKNRESLKRYSHIRPASARGGEICSALCPGTNRTCTLKRQHSGPHVAHSAFRKVVAVWDGRISGGRQEGKAKENTRIVKRKSRVPARKYARPPSRKLSEGEGWFDPLKTALSQFASRLPSLEESLFIVLGIAMVWFAIETSLRILGWK